MWELQQLLLSLLKKSENLSLKKMIIQEVGSGVSRIVRADSGYLKYYSQPKYYQKKSNSDLSPLLTQIA